MGIAVGGGHRAFGLVGTDLARLDSQHDEIFRHVHQVYALRSAGSARLRLQLVERLLDLARENFATEEIMLEAMEHPALRAHMDSHRQIADALLDLCASLGKGRAVGQGDVANAMAPLLVHHLKDDNVFLGLVG